MQACLLVCFVSTADATVCTVQEEYLGRYQEVFDEKQRTTMEAESCVSIAHEAHRIMRRLEKQLQLLLEPPLLQPPNMPAAAASSSCRKAALQPSKEQQVAATSQPDYTPSQAAGTAQYGTCLQAQPAAVPASKASVNVGLQDCQHHQQHVTTFAKPAVPSSTSSNSTVPPLRPQHLDFNAQLQQELQAYGRRHGASCGLNTHPNSSSSFTSKIQTHSTRTSNDNNQHDQLTSQHTWGCTHLPYQRVQPDGTIDGAIAALDAMLTDPTLNGLVAKYAPHVACPTAWHAADAGTAISHPPYPAAVDQCLQDSSSYAEPPSPGQPSGGAPLVASVAAAAGRRRLLQEQRKRQELHAAEWQRLQETAAAHVANKLCRTAAQKHASLRIRMRRFLQPGSLQAREDREQLQLARQAMGAAPRLQQGRSRALTWLEKRQRRLRSSWQRKYERLGGRTAVWMVCTVEPWLAQVQGKARAALGAVQKAMLPGKPAARDTTEGAATTALAAAEAGAAAAAVADSPAPPVDIEVGLQHAVQAARVNSPAGQRPHLLHVLSATGKVAAAALGRLSAARNNIRDPASFVEHVRLQITLLMHAANRRVEAAHKSSEAVASAAAMKGSTAARKLLVTLLPFMRNAAEQELVKKQQDEVKNRRRLSPQEGYSWDVYPTLGSVLEEKREFDSAAARAATDADAFEASRLGVEALQERQKRRSTAAASSARAAAEARALQGMQAALQQQQQWQLWSWEWQLRLLLAASRVPVLVSCLFEKLRLQCMHRCYVDACVACLIILGDAYDNAKPCATCMPLTSPLEQRQLLDSWCFAPVSMK
jgi:hypothetical protein